jgi:hypothetical protein
MIMDYLRTIKQSNLVLEPVGGIIRPSITRICSSDAPSVCDVELEHTLNVSETKSPSWTHDQYLPLVSFPEPQCRQNESFLLKVFIDWTGI